MSSRSRRPSGPLGSKCFFRHTTAPMPWETRFVSMSRSRSPTAFFATPLISHGACLQHLRLSSPARRQLLLSASARRCAPASTLPLSVVLLRWTTSAAQACRTFGLVVSPTASPHLLLTHQASLLISPASLISVRMIRAGKGALGRSLAAQLLLTGIASRSCSHIYPRIPRPFTSPCCPGTVRRLMSTGASAPSCGPLRTFTAFHASKCGPPLPFAPADSFSATTSRTTSNSSWGTGGPYLACSRTIAPPCSSPLASLTRFMTLLAAPPLLCNISTAHLPSSPVSPVLCSSRLTLARLVGFNTTASLNSTHFTVWEGWVGFFDSELEIPTLK